MGLDACADWCPESGGAVGDRWWHCRRRAGWPALRWFHPGRRRGMLAAIKARRQCGEVGDEQWGQPFAVGSC